MTDTDREARILTTLTLLRAAASDACDAMAQSSEAERRAAAMPDLVLARPGANGDAAKSSPKTQMLAYHQQQYTRWQGAIGGVFSLTAQLQALCSPNDSDGHGRPAPQNSPPS